MPETLRSEATIHLFGRAMTDLVLAPVPHDPGPVGALLTRASSKAPKQEPQGTIARIYAFAFQNEYVELASPALFVLYGRGSQVGANPVLDRAGLSRLPDTLNPDLWVWTVERDDTTVRLDVMAGTFNRVLLDYELADTGLQDFARGGSQLGTPTAVSSRRRPRRWRSDDD